MACRHPSSGALKSVRASRAELQVLRAILAPRAEMNAGRRVAIEAVGSEHRISPLIRPSRRFSTLGVAGSLLLHGLLVAPIMLGTHGADKSKPVPLGEALQVEKGVEGTTSMVWLDLSSISESQEDSADIAIDSRQFLTEPRIPDPESQDSGEKSPTNASSSQKTPDARSGEFAALYGKYLEQVSARVNRAWMRPRTELAAHRFECDVSIRQDRQGNVLSVELTRCDADARWRQTLVAAISGAAPLSAPSEPWLFTDVINLRFSAVDYSSAADSASDYEPAQLRLAMAPASTSQPLETTPLLTAPPMPIDGDVDLTIVGSDIRWEKATTPASPKP